uniref:glutathione-specific gamma-glutamylcyclotransferase n=1 Tax=Panstrongylus megistus TaxID=65343 RepID=A0A069DWY4_9HEMI
MSLWLFGYGSLIWKADFPFNRKISGYIQGFDRRFYQASTDHRGVPEKPGRVVTLLNSQDPEAKVYGMAYEIVEEDRPKVEQYLDFREKCGYSKISVSFFPYDSGGAHPENIETNPMKVITYIGLPTNEWYLGPAPLEDIATQIASSQGPSGTNAEYLFKLASAVRGLAPSNYEDKHLYNLESAVLHLLNSEKNGS